MQLFRGLATALATTAMLVASHPLAHAETLETALVKAYHNNPQLNAQRANVRATDEGVSRAQAGYRPKMTASGEYRRGSLELPPPKPVWQSVCRRTIIHRSEDPSARRQGRNSGR